MHNTIDYSKSPSPAFDAMQDVIEWLGRERYEKISPEMAKLTDRDAFAMYAGLAGIRGYPVLAWYEHYHGQGSWER